jgi:hypothetical protein
MRLVSALAFTLWLSFAAAGMTSGQHDAAGSASTPGQAPAAPAVPSENAPAQPPPPAPAEKPRAETAPAGQVPAETPPAEKEESDHVTKPKMNAAAPNEPPRKRHKHAVSAPGVPRKIVVREGGANEPAAQIAPGMTPAEAARQRQDAEKLLSSADNQLRQLAGRTLDARQQETVGQIRNYMDGAHEALKEGDLRRASTLAQKAHLLSEDLVRH